jgi:predicted nucleotidyltransferase
MKSSFNFKKAAYLLLTDVYKQQIVKIISKHIPESTVYLFGSRARGMNQQGADLDIAIDAGKEINKKILFAIKDDLEETSIPLMIDLVDLNSASEKLKEMVKKEGVIWKA